MNAEPSTCPKAWRLDSQAVKRARANHPPSGCDRNPGQSQLGTPVELFLPVLLGKVGTYDHDTPRVVDANGNAWEGFAITAPGVASRVITCATNQWKHYGWTTGGISSRQ